jgi:hypothetical protein
MFIGREDPSLIAFDHFFEFGIAVEATAILHLP